MLSVFDPPRGSSKDETVTEQRNGLQTGMFFHIEERQAWLRSHTHTIVFDRDPDFARFARDPSGRIKRMLRIWLAEQRGAERHLLAYLGTVTFCAVGPSPGDLRRVFRFASKAAVEAGQAPGPLRERLSEILRRYAGEAYADSAK